MNTPKRKTIALAVAASLSIPASSVFAADLEEIVVTATKRATSLQDTPLAISAFSGSDLEENHITNIYDLRAMAPTLQVRHNGDHGVPLIFIRGQGTIDQTEAGDQAVAFYTDGVFSARSQGSTALMYDMERVEILRGPQGTLFGRNSTAGAVSLVTAKPSMDEFKGKASMTFGSRDKQEVRAAVNAPISDTWAIRVAGVIDQQDGETKFASGNEFATARNYGTRDMSSFRISSLFEPSDNVSWHLSYENFNNNGTGDVPTFDFDNRVQNPTAAGNIDLSSDVIRTRFDYEFDNGLTASYIGGYTEMSQSQIYGNEFQGDTRETVSSGHTATQHELQLKNSDDSKFRWTAGLFSFEEENDIRFDILHGSWGFTSQDGAGQFNADGTPNNTVLSTFVQPNRGLDSTSAYFQGTLDITDSFRVTGGIRHTSDERSDVGGRSIDCTFAQGPGPITINFPNQAAADASNQAGCYYRQINDMKGDWSNETYLARAEWDMNDDVLLFLSYATGWKSGVLVDGNNASLTNSNSSPDVAGNSLLVQNPEENDSLELGMKATLMDGRMRLNANIFTMDYTDMQVTAAVINPVTGESTLTKTNAGSAGIDGIEFDSTILVGDNGTFGISGAYLDAKYEEFLGSETNFNNQNGLQWNSCAFGQAADGGCVGGVWDFAGNTLPNAPEVSFSASYKHEFELASGGVFTPRVRLTYQDDTYLTQENRGDRAPGTYGATDPGESNFDIQESYTKLDLSLIYASPDSRWTAELYLNNATDEAIKQEVQIGGTRTAYTWAPSREGGLRLSYNFN
ncbi:TonB-dependent receptor [Arenicella xantha]|uniref:Iron complex outermembrane receptor protein n=1 Tax=Arenicella xantha TaxID=644221 RepID=A0A395JPB6_9GAMM|nr:TonB-dependent receptor [Arenicella xantha]RBP49904.1 iron complex outermembrane receptor protein [Arenicella xantha]